MAGTLCESERVARVVLRARAARARVHQYPVADPARGAGTALAPRSPGAVSRDPQACQGNARHGQAIAAAGAGLHLAQVLEPQEEIWAPVYRAGTGVVPRCFTFNI